jgi:hypothetical protein
MTVFLFFINKVILTIKVTIDYGVIIMYYVSNTIKQI